MVETLRGWLGLPGQSTTAAWATLQASCPTSGRLDARAERSTELVWQAPLSP